MPVDPELQQVLQAFLQSPSNLQLGLYAGQLLANAGHDEAAVAAWSIADDFDPRVRLLRNAQRVPDSLRAASARADSAFRAFFTGLHINAVEQRAATYGQDLQRVREAIWPLTHDQPFEYREPLQRPVVFYMPGLPAMPVVPDNQLPWKESLESTCEQIRDEYQAAVHRKVAMQPYVPAETRDPRWSQLRGTLDWSSIHLYRDGQPTEEAAQFPHTLAALQQTDLVRVDGEPLEVFFSRLRPGAHIPPHFGLTNTRLTVHLPLLVPPDCAIRVGDNLYHWQPGKIIGFDDSYEHEAWNRSTAERVVLIFETHHPDLGPAEREAVEYAYLVRQHWLDRRRDLLAGFLP